MRVAHAVYHPANHQVWFWVTTGVNNDPNLLLVYHTLTGGWAQCVGLAPARCSALLPETQGAAMSRTLKPHYGDAVPGVPGVGRHLVKADDPTTQTDRGTAFLAEVWTRPVLAGGPGSQGHVGDVQIVARGTGAALTLLTIPNLGAFYAPAQQSTAVSLTPGTEEALWVFRRFEGSGLDETLSAQYHLVDAGGAAWVIDRLIVPVRPQGAVIT